MRPRGKTLRLERLEPRQLLAAVSVNPAGEFGNGFSNEPEVSRDGRYVVFNSYATDLVSGDNNPNTVADIFRRDLIRNTTQMVSVAADVAGANGSSFHPTLSADGRYVVFESTATNLLPLADANGTSKDLFLRDVVA